MTEKIPQKSENPIIQENLKREKRKIGDSWKDINKGIGLIGSSISMIDKSEPKGELNKIILTPVFAQINKTIEFCDNEIGREKGLAASSLKKYEEFSDAVKIFKGKLNNFRNMLLGDQILKIDLLKSKYEELKNDEIIAKIKELAENME